MISPYLASSLFDIFKPENKSQFILIKDLKSIRMNEFFIIGCIPVTLYKDMLTFRESNKSFQSDGDLLKKRANYAFNVGHHNPEDQKLFYEFGKEKKTNVKQEGRKSNRDQSRIKILKSPAIMDSGNYTIILSQNPIELFYS